MCVCACVRVRVCVCGGPVAQVRFSPWHDCMHAWQEACRADSTRLFGCQVAGLALLVCLARPSIVRSVGNGPSGAHRRCAPLRGQLHGRPVLHGQLLLGLLGLDWPGHLLLHHRPVDWCFVGLLLSLLGLQQPWEERGEVGRLGSSQVWHSALYLLLLLLLSDTLLHLLRE